MEEGGGKKLFSTCLPLNYMKMVSPMTKGLRLNGAPQVPCSPHLATGGITLKKLPFPAVPFLGFSNENTTLPVPTSALQSDQRPYRVCIDMDQ